MYSESNNLSVVNELLAICDLPLRERDFIEAEKAILGKTATVLYTIIVACCVAIIGAYGMSAQLGLGFLPIKILFVPPLFTNSICLLFCFSQMAWYPTVSTIRNHKQPAA